MPSLRRALAYFFGAKQRSAPTGWDALWTIAKLRNGGASTADPFTTHATVYSCVTKIAQSLATIPWVVREGTDDDYEDVLDGPLFDLFNRPNPLMSRNELKELSATYLLLSGECFWILDDGAGGIVGETEIPRFIWPVSGTAASEITGTNGQLQGWRLTGGMDNVTRDYPLHAVVQLTDSRSPARPWRGVSRLSAAMASVSSDYQAMLFNRSWYENGAAPSIILQGGDSQLTAEQAAVVRKQLDDGWRGASKAGKSFVAPFGLEVKDSPIKFAEMQFLEGLRWGKSQVAQVYGVPLALLGDSQDVNYNTYRHAKRSFYEATVLPLAQKMEDLIEVQLLQPRIEGKLEPRKVVERRRAGTSVWVEFDTTNLMVLREDEAVQLDKATKAMALGFTKNEANTKYELGFAADDEIGDTRFLPANLTPAEEILNPPEPPPALAPFAGQDPNAPPPPDGEKPGDSAKPVPKDEESEDTKNPDKGKEESPQRSRASEDARVRRDRMWADHSRALVPHEGAFRSRMQRYLYARRKEMLDFLGGKRAVRASDLEIEQFLREARNRWDAQLQAELAEPYRAAGTSGVLQIGKEIGGLKVFSAADPRLAEFLAKKALKVVTVNESLIDALRETLLVGTSNGETTAQLQERVRLGFGTSRASALRIARTEAAQTVNGSRDLAMKAEGIEKQEWISSRDAVVRDSHNIDGEVQPLGIPFSNGLKYPGDVDGPASETINCRCTSAPVLE